MNRRGKAFATARRSAGFVLAALFAVASARAQSQQPGGTGGVVQRPTPNRSEPASSSTTDSSARAASNPLQLNSEASHRFWDKENDWLFAGVAAGRAFDYASTLNMRRRGINEVFLNNAIVDNHPLFAGIEAAGTGASIGVSYIFHRTRHHQLERWTSILHFGIATGGAIRNYALKTPHP
jgi:hypothetical protein